MYSFLDMSGETLYHPSGEIMNRTTFRETARNLVPSAIAGLLSAFAFAAIVAWRQHETSPWLIITIYTVMTLPVFTLGWSLLWFDREQTKRESDAGADTIERNWTSEAAATAFWAVMAGVILLESLGGVLDIGLFSPIGWTHVLIVGGLAYGLSYVYLRRTQG